MIRKIIQIDEDKCNGCGLCATACHEGAIKMIDGKAKLIRDDYCDGLGDCLPVCESGAITFVQREALEYNEEEVKKNQNSKADSLPCGCPGTHSKSLKNQCTVEEKSTENIATNALVENQLNQWPVQIKLVPHNAPYFNNANLLIAADCAAYAYANFHNDFMKNKITLIGCPKLDDVDYTNKLSEIIKHNNIQSITAIRMEVPCCSGIISATKQAIQISKKPIPFAQVTLSCNGEIL